MGLLKNLFKARDKPKNRTPGSSYSFFFGGTTSGKPVNEHTAMQMTAVYSCVRILAEAVAGLPLHFYKNWSLRTISTLAILSTPIPSPS
jgi:phage portal protein BeeE